MMIDDINNLPEKVSSDELRISFLKAINSNEQIVEKLKCIKELAEKQWHNYELIESDLANLINKWLKKNLNIDSPTMVDYSLSIISYLGLQQVYEWIRKCKIKNIETQKLVEEAIEEFGEDISNPYRGM